MKIVIVGGSSSLAQALRPVLSKFAEVLTAGRTGCDISMDLAATAGDLNLPSNVDVVINTAADFGSKNMDALLQAENINVAGVLKLCAAIHRAQVKQFIQVSTVFALLDQSSRFFNAYALSKRHADAPAAVNAFGGNSKAEFVREQSDIPDNVLPIEDSLFRLIGYSPRISFAAGMAMEASGRRTGQ